MHAATDAERATDELRKLVHDSRRALTQARRVVSGYRRSSVRAELDAAAALLEAAGGSVRVVAADGVGLDAPDENARRAIRAALAQALIDEAIGGAFDPKVDEIHDWISSTAADLKLDLPAGWDQLPSTSAGNGKKPAAKAPAKKAKPQLKRKK